MAGSVELPSSRRGRQRQWRFDEGDEAEGSTICHNPMVIDKGNGETHVFFCGLWYLDKYVRTPKGWRIKQRVEKKCYFHNVPPGFTVPDK